MVDLEGASRLRSVLSTEANSDIIKTVRVPYLEVVSHHCLSHIMGCLASERLFHGREGEVCSVCEREE